MIFSGKSRVVSKRVPGSEVRQGVNGPFQSEIASSVETCLRRLHRWRIPPNWSTADWFDELRSVATAAALGAELAFDPHRGVDFDSFIRSRVLARTLAFYRREWSYVTRHVDGSSHPENQEQRFSIQMVPAAETEIPLRAALLREALDTLPRDGRWLIEELYDHERTEAEVARELGLSQRAVNKRKHAALLRLRQHIKRQ